MWKKEIPRRNAPVKPVASPNNRRPNRNMIHTLATPINADGARYTTSFMGKSKRCASFMHAQFEVGRRTAGEVGRAPLDVEYTVGR